MFKIDVGPPLFTLLQPEISTDGVRIGWCDQPLSGSPRPTKFYKDCVEVWRVGGWVGGVVGLVLYLGPELFKFWSTRIAWFHQIQPQGFILGMGQSISYRMWRPRWEKKNGAKSLGWLEKCRDTVFFSV